MAVLGPEGREWPDSLNVLNTVWRERQVCVEREKQRRSERDRQRQRQTDRETDRQGGQKQKRRKYKGRKTAVFVLDQALNCCRLLTASLPYF